MTIPVNITLDAINTPAYLRLKLIIHTWTLFSAFFAMMVSSLIIGYIGMNFSPKNHSKKSNHVSLFLTCNTCLAVICSSSTQILMTLSTIGGDLNLPALKRIALWNCSIRGYLHFVFINAIYLSCVLQAGYRLFRIAFRGCMHSRSIYSFLLYILTQWVASFLLIMPILIAQKGYSSLIEYLPNEFYCQVPMTSIRGIMFSILSVYFVPLCCIGVIYLWIILYIQRQRRPFSMLIRSIQNRDKRDTIIIKRICVVMIVLLSLGIPSSLFVIVFIITGHLYWASYRIGWMTIAMSFALISLSSLYVTPQIYKPLRILLRTSAYAQQTRSDSSSNLNNVEMQRRTKRSPVNSTTVVYAMK